MYQPFGHNPADPDVGHGVPGSYDDMTQAMFTLLEGTLSGEYPDGMQSYVMKLVYLLHLLVTNTLMLHMLIGLMCEIVTMVGSGMKDKTAVQQAKRTLHQHFKAVDTNDNGLLDIFEFFRLLQVPEVIIALQDMEIDVLHWITAADFVFENSSEISFSKFIEVALNLRANNFARVSDCVDIRKLINHEMVDLELRQKKFEDTVHMGFAGLVNVVEKLDDRQIRLEHSMYKGFSTLYKHLGVKEEFPVPDLEPSERSASPTHDLQGAISPSERTRSADPESVNNSPREYGERSERPTVSNLSGNGVRREMKIHL
jgi:hypothetical protein